MEVVVSSSWLTEGVEVVHALSTASSWREAAGWPLLVVAVFQVSPPVELLVRFAPSLPTAWEQRKKSGPQSILIASLTGEVTAFAT